MLSLLTSSAKNPPIPIPPHQASHYNNHSHPNNLNTSHQSSSHLHSKPSHPPSSHYSQPQAPSASSSLSASTSSPLSPFGPQHMSQPQPHPTHQTSVPVSFSGDSTHHTQAVQDLQNELQRSVIVLFKTKKKFKPPRKTHTYINTKSRCIYMCMQVI